jgi:bifunctional ADP-heptose synthase (sugar kinase/adenylyltransferase)/phosphoglycolate phosphatase-like HAD superfamily hydrolase
MKEERIKEILARIKNVKIAVYGDFCLDAYWLLDPRGSEVSVETGLQARAVSKHYYSLGGASNIVANLAAVEPAAIQVIGVIGDDIFGRDLTRQLHELGVDTTYLVVQKENFDTVTFGKPYLEGNEQPRIDFGFFNKRTEATDKALLKGIGEALETADALIINQQVPASITNESFIDQANALFGEFNDKIILLDSRHYGHKFKNICRKTNDLEAARLNGVDVGLDDVLQLADLRKYAQRLYQQFSKPVFLTRGPRGIITVDSDGDHEVPGIQLLKKLDPVGAGDTVTSALALCLGAGVQPGEAAEFANFAAAVTVAKLFQTGTASGPEILEVGKDADYIYKPELASDRRKARYFDDSEIELCYESIPLGRIKHAVFDNDGTISTLRQGWEQIMVPVMIKAILGDKYETADETLYHKVRNRVADYIDKSTGIQTIVQMEALVEIVTEFGVVSADKILDKFGYKEIYNDALMELVSGRIERFKRGQLNINDYTIKGVLVLLKALQQRGIKLYLASGTDRADVVAESEAMGYADLFEGGIYGSVGDITKYSKKMVIERIMAENNLQGPELAVFGDGPVEMRECRKRDGIAIGVASDEIRRHGLNIEKRTRVVKAGAHLVVPDFSQHDKLIELLFGSREVGPPQG